jgi:hypothetical protein
MHLPDFLEAKAKDVLPAAKRNVGHALQSGATVAFGTDVDPRHHRSIHKKAVPPTAVSC